MRFGSLRIAVCAAMILCATVGCGGSKAGPKEPAGAKGTVTGKVTHGGQPITKGILSLDNGQGYVLGAPIKPDGTFELRGSGGTAIPAGTYKVGITPPENPPPKPGATEMPPPPKIDGLDEKFYNPNSSGVTVEVKAGAQKIEIALD